MKKQTLVFAAVLALLTIISGFTIVNSNGSQIGWTTSPPDGPGDCGNCHGGGSTVPTLTVTATPAWTGNTYVPGATYTVTVQMGGYPKFGFDLEIINGTTSAAGDAGTFGPAISNCHITAPSSFPTVTNVSHNSPILTTSSATFKWVAPSSGNAYVWIAGNGVNGDGSTGGDHAKDMNFTLTPASSAGIEEHQADPFLLNVFPNPANEAINLNYTLTERGSISIEIFDLNGKLASTLLKETQEAGPHTFTGSTAGLGKGIYTVQIISSGLKSVKKLIIN